MMGISMIMLLVGITEQPVMMNSGYKNGRSQDLLFWSDNNDVSMDLLVGLFVK